MSCGGAPRSRGLRGAPLTQSSRGVLNGAAARFCGRLTRLRMGESRQEPQSFPEELEQRLGVLRFPAEADAPVPGVRRAAVVILLREAEGGDDVEILMIRRAEREGDPWSGHLALPGGRAEPIDRSLLDIALREVREEIGIDIGQGGRILGRLSTIAPLSAPIPRITVSPFVAWAPAGAVPRPDPTEVADTFWISLGRLRADGLSARVRRTVGGEVRHWPAYPSPRGPIWGITERILTELISLLS